MQREKVRSEVREKHQGVFGFERGLLAHYNALLGAMRHYESVGDDASLGLVLVALVRGRKPWTLDLRYEYFKMAKLERFSEILLVLFRWLVRNVSMTFDETRRLLKKLEQHQPYRHKRQLVRGYLCRTLEEKDRLADAYDVAQLKPPRYDVMGRLRKKQLAKAIGRGTVDLYQPIDPVVWKRTGRNAKSLMGEAERHLRSAVKNNPEDTTSRMHLVELLLANGDEAGALEVTSCEVMDFDAHAQRLAMLLARIHQNITHLTFGPSNAKEARDAPGWEDGTALPELDEILQCCSAMLSLDPSSSETINLLVRMHGKGYFGPQHAERLASVLAPVLGAVDDEGLVASVRELIASTRHHTT